MDVQSRHASMKQNIYEEIKVRDVTNDDIEIQDDDVTRDDDVIRSEIYPDLINNDEKDEEESPAISFTTFKELTIFILVAFYLADLALDIWVAVRFFTFKHPMNAWLVIFCILVPNVYSGYKSLQWYLRSHDQEPIRKPLPWMIRVFFFPLSLLLRYYDTWKFGRSSRHARATGDRRSERRLFSAFLIESAEVSMLRLFIIFLEDAPIAVLNLRDVILTPPHVQKHRLEMVLVVMFKLIFTMTLGVVHFLTSTKAVYHAAKVDQYRLMASQWMQKDKKEHWETRGFLSWPGEICIYMWHLCAIGSRLVAYAMFVSVYHKQLWILMGVRWLLNTCWIKFDAWEISLTNCAAFGGVYLFSFVPTSPKPQLFRILLYYTFTLTENTIIAVVFSHGMEGNPYGTGAYAFVFGGAFLSMIFMSMYYGFFHPAKKSKLKTFQLQKRRKDRNSTVL